MSRSKFTLPRHVAGAFCCLSITLVVIGLAGLEHVVRPHDSDPRWWRWITPAAFSLALLLSLCVAFAPIRSGRGAGIRVLMIVSLCLSIPAFLSWPLLPRIPFDGETADNIKCASNLRQIWAALQIYSAANRGALPDDLDTLLKTTEITRECFVCPMADNTTHLSYTYLGKGKTSNLTKEDVLAYDGSSDHHGRINVLYGDGHVERWQTLSDLQHYMATTKPTTR